MSNIDRSAGASRPPVGEAVPAPYTAQSIRVLEGLEAVRMRPGMYFGGTGANGQLHAVQEAVDNGLDEHLAGHASTLEVWRELDGTFVVRDDGRGIPEARDPRRWRVTFANLHAFTHRHDGPYHTHMGLHGAGIASLNAVCSHFSAQIDQGGRSYYQAYRRGEPLGAPVDVGPTFRRGTTLRFRLDPSIFEGPFPLLELQCRLRRLAYLQPRLGMRLDGQDLSQPQGLLRWATERARGRVRRARVVWTRLDGLDVQLAVVHDEGAPGARHLDVFVNHGRIVGGSAHAALEPWLADTPADQGGALLASILLPVPRYRGPVRQELDNPEVEAVLGRIRHALQAIPQRFGGLADGSRAGLAVLRDWARETGRAEVVSVFEAARPLG